MLALSYTRVTASARVHRNKDKMGGFNQSISSSFGGEELWPTSGKISALPSAAELLVLLLGPRGPAEAAWRRRAAHTWRMLSLVHPTVRSRSHKHWKSKAIILDRSPGCDIFYKEMGSAFISAIKYKQLVFQTAWPFTVANLHIFILNEMVSGHSPWISNEIFRPPDILHSVADTFSRLHNLLSLISLTNEASLPMHQLTDSSQELRNAGE